MQNRSLKIGMIVYHKNLHREYGKGKVITYRTHNQHGAPTKLRWCVEWEKRVGIWDMSFHNANELSATPPTIVPEFKDLTPLQRKLRLRQKAKVR